MTKETYCLGVDLLPEFKKDFEFIESEYQALQNKLQTYRRVYENCPNFKKDIKSVRKKAYELEGDINASFGRGGGIGISQVPNDQLKLFNFKIKLIKKAFAELNKEHLTKVHDFVE